ncbi:MAG: redoxin domain-containing protein, partial [Bacteroidales bacterium]|nr:redoxin domain-containing protein [Bacteroidales bacterium]
MKKVLLLFAALILGFSVKAQCPLTQAVDFTATDVHGETVNLFEILDGGQYVLIDFFFTSCGPCQNATPKIVESYYTMGCNQHEVFYMEISDRDSDTQCLNWVENFEVEYPTISGASGGAQISSTYGISAFPTVILIAPNRQIVIQDLWPISNAQTIVSALQAQGVNPHDCNSISDGAPDFTTNDIDGNEIHLYDILDAGQAVCINFFLSIDPTSVNIMPAVTEAYEKFGCNDHDIFFMEISPYDEDDAARNWAETHGVQYPTISRTGGGSGIAQSFMVGFYPTVMLILPDHSIAIPDVAPIYTSDEIVNAFEAQGIEQHPCD